MGLAEWLVLILTVPTTVFYLIQIGKEIKELRKDTEKKKPPTQPEKH